VSLVSVLVSVFDRAASLDETLQSVLADTGVEHELVIIDDGSP